MRNEISCVADPATEIPAGSNSGMSARVLPRASIDEELGETMFRLYAANYADTAREIFARDLAAKTHVLVLTDPVGQLCGFSTIELYSTSFAGGIIRVMFSGDTIISREHWGSQALAFEWIRFAGEVERSAPAAPLYWLLIVKGHRTYRFLPTFAQSYIPHHACPATAFEQALRDVLAREKFGEAYDSTTGVIRFPTAQGRLRPLLADISQRHMRLPEVGHFLRLNPGYRDGDELVCLCRLAEQNLRPRAARIFSARRDAAALN